MEIGFTLRDTYTTHALVSCTRTDGETGISVVVVYEPVVYPVDEKISKDNAGSLRHSQLRFKWRARETSHDTPLSVFSVRPPLVVPFDPWNSRRRESWSWR